MLLDGGVEIIDALFLGLDSLLGGFELLPGLGHLGGGLLGRSLLDALTHRFDLFRGHL